MLLQKNELLLNKTDEFQQILTYQNDLNKNKHSTSLKPVDYVSTINDRLLEVSLAKQHLQAQHHDSDGYITLFQKFKDNTVFQWNYTPQELLEELHKWVGQNDVYFSQNTFFIPKRITSYVRQLRAFYADLDFYNKSLSREEVLEGVQDLIQKGEIPQYNLIINSGRGVVLIWFIKHAPKQLMSFWATIQTYLNQKLEKYGADSNAMDIARVFRLSGSYNSKSGKMVTFSVVSDNIHTMSEIHKKHLPELELKPKPKKGRKNKVQHIYNLYSLNLTRREDLVKLLQIREFDINKNSHKHENKGCRETFFFLYRYWSMFFIPNTEDIIGEMKSLNELLKEPLEEEELIYATKSAEKAYQDRLDDKKNEIARSLGYPAAGYNYSNIKLIKNLQITEAEQRYLDTIICKKIKQERNTKNKNDKRRENGVKPRDEYKQQCSEQSEETLMKIKELFDQGLKGKQIAQQLGLSEKWVSKKKQELKQQNLL